MDFALYSLLVSAFDHPFSLASLVMALSIAIKFDFLTAGFRFPYSNGKQQMKGL